MNKPIISIFIKSPISIFFFCVFFLNIRSITLFDKFLFFFLSKIIHTHFWLKRQEILQQCETWLAEMDTYTTDKRTVRSIAQSTLALKVRNQFYLDFKKFCSYLNYVIVNRIEILFSPQLLRF